MAHNPISLDLLRALDAIDQRGSFAAAAHALHKVPSALTYTIQKVEQDLDMALFDRSGHKAKLTQAGRLILEQGRLILRDIDALARSAKQIASGWEPELHISVDTLYETEHLFPLIKEFNREHPYVKVKLLHDSLSGTWEKLLNKKADLILSGDRIDPKLEGYRTQLLGSIESVFAVSKDHPLASEACTITDAMIEPYTVIVVPDSSELLTPQTVGWTKQSQKITVASMRDKIAAQASGLGVGYLPKHRIQSLLDSGDLVLLNMPSHHSKAVAAWRKESPGPALQWFLDRLPEIDLGLIAT